jgi:4-diphosphocytidyl-2-C-methyl-D-erythritol kinase
MTCRSACGPPHSNDQGRQILVSSPSKLNLFLEVLARRDDGFHELETIMVRTSFCDTLSLSPRSDSRLVLRFSDTTSEVIRNSVPLDQSNLILRAAEALRNRVGFNDGADLVLHKVIPPQSGLGGGSGNAAATLLGLRRLYRLPISDEQLHELAAGLGSDVNFLLSGARAAVCRGRGEVISPLQLRGRYFFVATRPHQGNQTGRIFSGMRIPQQPVACGPLVELLQRGDASGIDQLIFNRLTDAARSHNPAMRSMMDEMQRRSRQHVWMSGSGSTVFVRCQSFIAAQRMRGFLQQVLRREAWVLQV